MYIDSENRCLSDFVRFLSRLLPGENNSEMKTLSDAIHIAYFVCRLRIILLSCFELHKRKASKVYRTSPL